MDVLILTEFVSVLLVVGAVILLLNAIYGGHIDHGDRLSLLPLEEDAGPTAPRPTERATRPVVGSPEPEGE